MNSNEDKESTTWWGSWWDSCWYIVKEDVTIEGFIQVIGDVNLLLMDGTTLTAKVMCAPMAEAA